jgi:hypothetical protein
MNRAYRLIRNTVIFTGIAALYTVPVFSQGGQATIIADGNTYNVVVKYNKRLGPGPAQHAGGSGSNSAVPGTNANASGGLAFYTANYTSFGRSYPFQIVGTDPSLGAGTTTIPTVIVPIQLTFPNTRVLDGTNQVSATENSPIFLTADYTTGGTDLGVTQYGDAIQRGEFWNLPGFSQAGFHVLLGAPTIAATVSITVPSSGCTASSHNLTGSCGNTYNNGAIGVVNSNFFDAQLNNIIASGAYAANVMPIFLTDNVFEGDDATVFTCCTLGYHNSEGPPIATAHTWIYAAYTRSGTFGGNAILDVQSLSHEVSEWLNDPFVGAFQVGGINFIPPAKLPGQGGACIINFETGDPLEAPPVVFTKVTNATTYHLQDEVFLPWYLHTTPSFSVNGNYTYLGTFTTPSTLCGPG